MVQQCCNVPFSDSERLHFTEPAHIHIWYLGGLMLQVNWATEVEKGNNLFSLDLIFTPFQIYMDTSVQNTLWLQLSILLGDQVLPTNLIIRF